MHIKSPSSFVTLVQKSVTPNLFFNGFYSLTTTKISTIFGFSLNACFPKLITYNPCAKLGVVAIFPFKEIFGFVVDVTIPYIYERDVDRRKVGFFD
jgi:hypothetical protein